MVQRLAKGVLPPNTQIQKDAIVAMSKGATVFINHIADKYGYLSFKLNFFGGESPSYSLYILSVSSLLLCIALVHLMSFPVNRPQPLQKFPIQPH